MKKLKRTALIALLVLSSYTSIFATTDFTKKQFWQQDKRDHFKLTAGIAGTTTIIARHYGNSKFDSFLYGVATATTIGIIKEIADGHDPKNHTEEIGDVYADVLGAITGSLLTFHWKW